jgi:hypothetical protein
MPHAFMGQLGAALRSRIITAANHRPTAGFAGLAAARMRIDSEPHNPLGFLSAIGVVNAHDELTKRQVSLPVIGFHDLKCNRVPARMLWGVYPMPDLLNPAPT